MSNSGVVVFVAAGGGPHAFGAIGASVQTRLRGGGLVLIDVMCGLVVSQ